MIKKMSVSDLILALNDAASKMSAENDHRTLLFNAAFSLRQLVDRLYELEGPPPDQVN